MHFESGYVHGYMDKQAAGSEEVKLPRPIGRGPLAWAANKAVSVGGDLYDAYQGYKDTKGKTDRTIAEQNRLWDDPNYQKKMQSEGFGAYGQAFKPMVGEFGWAFDPPTDPRTLNQRKRWWSTFAATLPSEGLLPKVPGVNKLTSGDFYKQQVLGEVVREAGKGNYGPMRKLYSENPQFREGTQKGLGGVFQRGMRTGAAVLGVGLGVPAVVMLVLANRRRRQLREREEVLEARRRKREEQRLAEALAKRKTR